MHTAEDIARVRAEMRARREALLRERIRALHAADRLPARQIAALTGVCAAYVEQVTGETEPPLGIIF